MTVIESKLPADIINPTNNSSPLWEKALEQYRKELQDGDDYNVTLGVANMEELLAQARSLEPPTSRHTSSLKTLSRLEPILGHLNDFSAVVALCLGADAKSAAIVWGSIRLILTLVMPSGGDTLRDVLNMLEELSLSLPRFKAYENTLPMNEAFEASLLAAYTEMTCFCARTINFFRKNPHSVLQRKTWPEIDGDFNQTMKRLKRLSQAVDSEAEAARMRVDGERNAEILAVMQSLQASRISQQTLPCYCIPSGISGRFYGRQDALEHIKDALKPGQAAQELQSIALYGMGGVGKTQIALRYATEHRDQYDAILWISADNSIKMAQSFLEVAQRLQLVPDSQEAQDSAAAMSKVKVWLGQTACKWLVIFDNADDIGVLKHAWPSSGSGSILLTSRDFSASFSPAAQGYHVQPFDNAMGSAALLALTGQEGASEADQTLAIDIAEALGGLPLALSQISGFIVQRRLALKDFLPLYERNSTKINAKKTNLSAHEHSLGTVWEMALSQLSEEASTLQKLLAFLDPDGVHESILTDFEAVDQDAAFAFLNDEMDFLDAKEILLRAALIEHFDDETIKVHRLVQSAVMSQLSSSEKSKFTQYAIQLLLKGFPNTWEHDVGHQFSAWKTCEMCLPHMNFLTRQVKKWKLELEDPQSFSDLVLRCCWYLYERENYFQALDMLGVAIESFADKNSLAYASAIELIGLLHLDNAQSTSAMERFEASLRIRESLLGPDDPFIAASLNTVALAFTELGELTKAHETHQRAIDIRLRTKSDRIGNSYSNMASTLLRMGKADEAEEMLARCPSLKDFNDETFLSTGNPRFSGDMVLLSRIRATQGRLDDAVRLASKALGFRQTMLGNRLKTCDAMYLVATLLQRQGNLATAITLLNECVTISEGLPEGKGYLARARFRMSELLALEGDLQQSQSNREIARALGRELLGDAWPSDDTEASYDKLVVWMLW